ncbi:hypothetical protein D3C76_1373170 [compost metagenome]
MTCSNCCCSGGSARRDRSSGGRNWLCRGVGAAARGRLIDNKKMAGMRVKRRMAGSVIEAWHSITETA